MEIERALRFARKPGEDEPLGVSIIRRPGKILVRWFATTDDEPAAEARFVLMLQGS